MDLFWSAGKPLTTVEILELSPKEKSWKDNSIYIMFQTLQKKGAIKEIGAIKGKRGKYLRLFEPVLSRREYFSKSVSESLDEKSLPLLVSALVNEANVSKDTINKLEEIIKKKKAEMK